MLILAVIKNTSSPYMWKITSLVRVTATVAETRGATSIPWGKEEVNAVNVHQKFFLMLESQIIKTVLLSLLSVTTQQLSKSHSHCLCKMSSLVV
jgi:hypothetical protein